MNGIGVVLEIISNLAQLAEHAYVSGATHEEISKGLAIELERARIAISNLDAMHLKNSAEADAILATATKKVEDPKP